MIITTENIQSGIAAILQLHPQADTSLVSKGVEQVAALWQEEDGSSAEFIELVTQSYAPTAADKELLYQRLAYIIEQCNQSADLLNNTLQEPTTLVGKGEPLIADWIISGYNPMAHFTEDMFEQAVIELFENMGYTHIYAPDMERDYSSPLLDSVLMDSLVKLNKGLPLDAINEAIAKLRNFDTGSLLQKNMQ